MSRQVLTLVITVLAGGQECYTTLIEPIGVSWAFTYRRSSIMHLGSYDFRGSYVVALRYWRGLGWARSGVGA
jgi:hypothetical protein